MSRSASPLRAALATLAFFALSAAPAPARAAPPESEVAAAIVANFVHYVDWPDKPPATAELLICVAGRGATADALLAYDGKSVHGRRLTVEPRLHAAASSNCRILFLGETSSRSTIDWLRDLSGQPILTVSEGADFLLSGGMIGLDRTGSRISFAIGINSVRRAGLRIDSRLMRLARSVHGE